MARRRTCKPCLAGAKKRSRRKGLGNMVWSREQERYVREEVGTCRMVRERLNAGGYASGGRYFGVGTPLYRFTCADGSDGYVRGGTRAAAKAALLKMHPSAKVK